MPDDTASTNDQEPDFGPADPLYPPTNEICRVSGPALPGDESVYPAFMTQLVAGTVTLRDRAPCYVTEGSGKPLVPAYYDSLLVGAFNGLPLYATFCC